MKKKCLFIVIIFFSILTYSQSIDNNLFKNKKDLKKQFRENFRDSIGTFSTNHYKRDLKYMNRLTGLKKLIIMDFYCSFKGFSALSYTASPEINH